MRLTGSSKLIGIGLGAVLAWQGAAHAQSPEEFYKGKTVTLVVSASAGGASDVLGRRFADFLKKHLPGSPELIVVNKPGAGGMVAASQLMNTEEKDGTVIAFLQRNNLFRPLVTDNHKQFDPRKVNWIGSLNKEDFFIAVMDHSPVQSAAEMVEKKMVLGATSFANENRTFPAMMNTYFGTKFEIVQGYKGGGALRTALEQGEIDGWTPALAALSYNPQAAALVKTGRMKPIMVLDWQKNAEFPNLPTFSDFVKDDRQRAVVDFFLAPLTSGRPFAVPGEVPADRVAALRKAFDDAVNDPELVALMARLGAPIQPITGQAVEEIRERLYATSADTLADVRKILVEKK